VYLDAAPDRALAAEVMRIDPQAMFTPENTYFRDDRVRQVVGVKILLKQNTGEAKLGMSAEGRILLGASE
jgi:HlyD family secretion protein